MIALQLLITASPGAGAVRVLDPQSPQARAIVHLGIVAGVIFALILDQAKIGG